MHMLGQRVAQALRRAGRCASGAAASVVDETAHAAPLVVAATRGDAHDRVNQMLRSVGSTAGPLALDTEFTSFPSYSPVLELIQVADTTGAAACIDCAPLSQAAVASLLRPAVDQCELVVHDGRTDLRLLRELGLVPTRVFDTQLAAGFTRCGGRIGLGDLAQSLLGVKMDKSAATSDWRVRPLSATQLEYAANDVRYMLEMRERLLDELDRVGRAEWFADEMQELLRETADEGLADSDLWTTVRRARKLRESPSAIAVLRALAEWREATARTVNIAPALILSDDAIVQLAAAPPTTLQQLGTVRAARGSTVRLHGRALLHTIHEALDAASCAEETGEPLPELPVDWLTNDPSDPMSVRAATQAAALRHRLFAMVFERSAELNMSHELLATPADLTELLEASAADEETEGVRVLRGWRREVIGSRLVELKHSLTMP